VIPWWTATPRKEYDGQNPYINNFVAKVNRHRCEPAGCPKPVGCSNTWTEFKYVFGSCRQFFGSSEATRGIWHNTHVPPSNPLGLP
jgi:hypothetical protein